MAMISKKPKIAPTTMDKISQLPEPILHHILNFLETAEATRTAILSKNWRTIFNSRPVLSFIQSRYKTEQCFIDGVDDSIQKFLQKKRSIQKFELDAQSYHPDRWDLHINRWIHQLVNDANIEELWLESRWTPIYMLPPIMFRSKTITSLRLAKCSFKNCDNVTLPNLSKLSLVNVDFEQEIFKNLISGCPSMEILELIQCKGLSKICISNLDRLQKVELRSCPGLIKVTIIAAKLRVFKICRCNYRDTECEINLFACELTLKKLTFFMVGLTTDVFKSFISKFRELEKLVVTDHILERIEILNHRRLLKLELYLCQQLEVVEIDAPNLQCLQYRYNKIPFYRVNCAQITNFRIDFFIPCDSIPKFTNWSDNFKECFTKFGHLKDMKLIVEIKPDVIVCDDIQNSLDILYAIKDMNRNMHIHVTSISYECIAYYLFSWRLDILRRVFWDTVSLVSLHSNVNDFVKTLEEKKVKGNEEANCCKYKKYTKCWGHYLYDFERVTKPEEETPNLFLSSAAMGYNISKFKLQWIDQNSS